MQDPNREGQVEDMHFPGILKRYVEILEVNLKRIAILRVDQKVNIILQNFQE